MNEVAFGSGIARNAGESAYPQLWRGLLIVSDPRTGQQGTRITNFASNGLNGTLTNGTLYSPSKLGRTFLFDGSNDSVDFTSTSYGLGIRRNATYMAWARADRATSGQDGMIISDYGPGASGMSITFRDGPPLYILFWVYPNNHRITYLSSIVVGQWAHICGVMDGANMYLYVNGRQVDSTTLGEDIGDSGSPLRFGRRADGAGSYDLQGAMTDVRIYNRALSALEVQMSYMGASPLVRKESPIVFAATSSGPVIPVFMNQYRQRAA